MSSRVKKVDPCFDEMGKEEEKRKKKNIYNYFVGVFDSCARAGWTMQDIQTVAPNRNRLAFLQDIKLSAPPVFLLCMPVCAILMQVSLPTEFIQ